MEGNLPIIAAKLVTTVESEIVADEAAFSTQVYNSGIYVDDNEGEASLIDEVYPLELLCIFCFKCQINHIKKTTQGVRIPTRLMPRQYAWVEIIQPREHSITIRLLPHIQQATQVNGCLSAAQVFSRVKNSCPFCFDRCNSDGSGSSSCVRNYYTRTTCIDCSYRQFRWDFWNPFDNSIEEATKADLTFKVTIKEFDEMSTCAKLHAPN